MTRSKEKFVVVRGGSGEWLRGGTAGFRGMAQVWSGEELWRIGGYNCPQVRGDTRSVRGGKRRCPRKAPGAARRCRLVVVRGEISPAWAYVLRASLKTQSPSDFWNFVGFIPLAQRRLGR